MVVENNRIVGVVVVVVENNRIVGVVVVVVENNRIALIEVEHEKQPSSGISMSIA